MNYLFTKNIAIALLAISLTSCASSQNGEKIKSLISPSSDLEVTTTTEPQATEEIPQSSTSSEVSEPKPITQSASGITPQQINRRVKQFTVRIDGVQNGSGVIIDQSDDSYTVLTNWHVVQEAGQYTIQTSDGRQHQVNYQQVKQLPGVDLALVKFTSEQNYQIASVGDSDYLSEGQGVHLAGYPGIKVNNDRLYRFYNLNIVGLLDTPINQGYSVLYEGETISGMSGSPLLNGEGNLVGIHGIYRVDDPKIRKGSSYAIPINTYKELVAEETKPTETVATQPNTVTTKEDKKSAGDSTNNHNKQAGNKQAQTITEISWKSSLKSFGLNKKANIGKQFSFQCPKAPADIRASVWGSDNYATSSSICLSGVHAGVITRDGGIVSLQLNPSQEFYTGRERNGVTSADWGSPGRSGTSFSFVSNSVATNNQQPQSTLESTPTENLIEPRSDSQETQVAQTSDVIATQPGPNNMQVELINTRVTGQIFTLIFRFHIPNAEEKYEYAPSIKKISYIEDDTGKQVGVLKNEEGDYLTSHSAPFSTLQLYLSSEPVLVWLKFPVPSPETQTISINFPEVLPFDGVPLQK